jgi:hypothetical protein
MAVLPATLYVSDQGDDRKDGKSPSTAFRTLGRLTAELRQRRGQVRKVRLEGAFRLDETWTVGAEADGVEFVGPATISGGVPVGGWRKDEINGQPAWSAASPGGVFLQLFDARGNRMPRSRWPKTGFAVLAGLPAGTFEKPWNEGQDQATLDRAFLPKANLSDVDVVVHHYWVTSRLPIRELDRETGEATFRVKSVWRLTDDYTGKPAPYAIENALEALSKPGQWYHDRAAGRLYVLGDREPAVVVPRLETLVRIVGAQRAIFRNLEFRHTEHPLAPGSAGYYQAAFGAPGAVMVEGGKNVRLERCRFRNLGGYGVEIKGGAVGTTVSACTMRDLGAGGVKIADGTRSSTVEDCVIEEAGRVHASAVGILIGNSGGNRIRHNLIRDLFYTGISVGWTWGYADTQTDDNLIEWNDIRDIGQEQLSDMGGIYTLGRSPGSVIRYNRIQNVRSRGYGGWGIYFDEGTTGMLAEFNLVRNTTTGGFHQHYGRDNLVRNNVFAHAQREGQVIRTRKEDHLSFTFERNVMVWRGTPLLAGNVDGNFVLRSNLYWREDAAFEPHAFDTGSLVADPKLGSDGMPRSDVVERVGFQRFRLDRVGPRRR